MMLEHLGEEEAAALVMQAVEAVLVDPELAKTPDLGGKSTTAVFADAVRTKLLEL